MRAVIQRVLRASVEIDGATVGSIRRGLLILLGVGARDTEREASRLWAKASSLRIFEDEDHKTNLSLADVAGEVLVVSQFTLFADCKHGRRPSFTGAGDPAHARGLYEYFTGLARAELGSVQTGEFGAMMEVSLVNDGPFTVVLDTDSL